ncbi:MULTISPECIES: hypothetical protein [unclassified Pseudomonas]|uniref:hypothetical protein n=1 Tax=unclassified Pseudomonas TaxID=196821 RepID=UPI001473DF10|nr:hypothetical protein [Pseudomonas sp. WS 5146]NMX57783.1 hypothetical protein [Pseudomonas sp. WS 5146]
MTLIYGSQGDIPSDLNGANDVTVIALLATMMGRYRVLPNARPGATVLIVTQDCQYGELTMTNISGYAPDTVLYLQKNHVYHLTSKGATWDMTFRDLQSGAGYGVVNTPPAYQ